MSGSSEHLVYKSNALIEGRYKLTPVANKISVGIIACVDPFSKEPLPEFELSLKELSAISGVKVAVLRNSIHGYAQELKAVPVTLRKHPDAKSFTLLGLFRKFTYDDEKRVLLVRFEEELEEHIREFSGNFTKYRVGQVQSLISATSVRLYEILRMAYNKQKEHIDEPIYECLLEDLKPMLGMKKTAYQGRFNNFCHRAIDLAQEELFEKTDLSFQYTPIKKGRKIIGIRFAIYPNEINLAVQESLEGTIVPDNVDLELVGMVRSILPNMKDNEIYTLAAGYERPFITESLLSLIAAKGGKQKIENDIAYFYGILNKKRQEAEAAREATRHDFGEYDLSDLNEVEKG